MTKQLSRPQRWAAATKQAREALDRTRDAQDELHEALGELADIQSEYRDWFDNMPEGLQSSPTGELLSELCDIDLEIEVDLDDYEDAISNAENAQLPQGFGKD